MQLLNAARAGGKTIRCLQWLMENPDGVLYTFSEAEANRLRDIMRRSPVTAEAADRILAANDHNTRGVPHPSAIDNLDLYLAYRFQNLRLATVTGWDMPEYQSWKTSPNRESTDSGTVSGTVPVDAFTVTATPGFNYDRAERPPSVAYRGKPDWWSKRFDFDDFDA